MFHMCQILIEKSAKPYTQRICYKTTNTTGFLGQDVQQNGATCRRSKSWRVKNTVANAHRTSTFLADCVLPKPRGCEHDASGLSRRSVRHRGSTCGLSLGLLSCRSVRALVMSRRAETGSEAVSDSRPDESMVLTSRARWCAVSSFSQ